MKCSLSAGSEINRAAMSKSAAGTIEAATLGVLVLALVTAWLEQGLPRLAHHLDAPVVGVNIKEVVDDISSGGGEATGENDQIGLREGDVFPIDVDVVGSRCSHHEHRLCKQGEQYVVGPNDG